MPAAFAVPAIVGAVTVRAATPDDASALVALFAQLGHPASREAIAARLVRNAIPGYAAWVFDTDDLGVVGFAGGHVLLPFENDDPAAQLMILVVDERSRGRGVGKTLVAVFEDWARGQGAAQAVVGSGNGRVEAHHFYEGRGYEQRGLRFKKPL